MGIGLIYFLADTDDGSPGKLAEAGLAHAFEGEPIRRTNSGGPDRSHGTLLANRGSDEFALLYKPDEQTWQRIPGAAGPAAWVGRYAGQKIGPDDLARKRQLAGYWVELVDGNKWLVPLALSPLDDEPRLPTMSKLDEQAQWVRGNVLERYARLWDIAKAWNDARAIAADQGTEEEEDEDEDKKVADEEAVKVVIEFGNLHGNAVHALAANYRIADAEVALLGLLTEPHAIEILQLLTDWPSVIEGAKKKDRPEPSAG